MRNCPHFHRAGGGLTSTRKENNKTETKFQLTNAGLLKQDKNASVASLRSW